MSRVEVDILIVGAGPVGLFGAYYAGVRGLRTAVVDSLSQVGGQVTAMYPEKQIYDIAGFPAVSGRDLISGLVAQAAQQEPVYLLGQEAQLLERVTRETSPDDLVIRTSTGTEVHCAAVVITGGIGTFTPRPLPAGEDFLGRGLDYFVPSAADYAGKEVVIVGGGDSAIDWALMLEPIAAHVTLVHRREAFRAHAASVAQVRETSVEIITNAQVTGMEGGDQLEKAIDHAQGPAAAERPLPAGRRRTRLHGEPRAAAGVGARPSRQPAPRGRLSHAHQPARCVRGGRHHRLRRQGPADRRRVR